MGENGAKNFKTLVKEGVNFKSLAKTLVGNCEVKHTDNDLLYGKTRIFLNEKFKHELDEMLMIKQEKKKDALSLIAE